MEPKTGIARLVCGRRTKWIVLAAWIVLTVIAGPLAGKLTGVQNNDTSQWLPSTAESTQVVRLQDKFQSGENAAVVVVYQRLSGITAADRAKAAADARRLATVNGIAGAVTGPVSSADGKALQVVVPLQLGVNGWNKLPQRTDNIGRLTRSTSPGLTVYLAGPGSFYADSARAFSGIDSTLLLATVLVVIITLLVAYRSPVLWLLPVVSAFISLSVSEAFIYLLAKHAGLTVNGQSQGILTILVFGASTDYALLLIARYREELRSCEDRHQAMARALRRAGPAIIASAATVVIGLLCLEFAEMNSTKGLGPVAAVGIVVGLIAMITLLPALLVIFGRWLFWPARPVYGVQPRNRGSIWLRLGHRIARRPRTIWIGTALVLAALAAGVTQLHATGLPSQASFTRQVESVTAQQVLNRHFPAGQDGQPVVVIGKATATAQVQRAVSGTKGILRASPPVVRDGLVSVQATLLAQPDSKTAQATVTKIRTLVHAIPGADAKVGGQTALTMDMARANTHDNRVIIPIVLAVVVIILALLLRAIVAPLLLIGTVVLSYGAALGISALLFKYVFGFKGADSSFPLFIFVFLVALGVDYNIFLMTRVREEAQKSGTRPGALAGLAATGGVITSAGVVLAATFAVFGTIPVVVFTEIGIAVAVGVLLDTFIVRSVLVTALTLDFGRWMWWPGKLAATPDAAFDGQRSAATAPVGRGPS
jgi:RND superfamily putative drug exporter